jgi:hypothetical protein
MERLFSPCTRSRDLLAENRDEVRRFEHLYIEIARELNLDASTEELLNAERAFTYADLYATLGNGETIAWFTPDAAVAREDGDVDVSWMQHYLSYHFYFNTNDEQKMVALARYPEDLLEICDIVLRLLAASAVHSVSLRCLDDVELISPPPLANMMEQCQSLKTLELKYLRIDEIYCLALGEYSRPGLEIELIRCEFTSAGSSALADVLSNSQGPTKLDDCDIDNSFLANGLRGNSRLKSLTPQICGLLHACKRDVLAIADALKENKGLVELNLSYELNLIYGCFRENDETWGAICDSLKTHPTLEVLNLSRSELTAATNTPEAMKSRVQALLDMMRMNQLIHTIRLNDLHSRHELFQGSVIPYLETNRLRPRLLAIQKTRPILYRAKVLGRALLSARTNANSFWMLLSGNAEVAFPSKAATANLPRLATDTATVSASATAVAALSPTAGATSTISVSDVDSVATPTIIRKRKARP